MIDRRLIGVLLCAALAGCAASRASDTAYSVQEPTPPSREEMQAATYGAGAPVPAMEDGRKINDQSCTTGIDLLAGNLRCK